MSVAIALSHEDLSVLRHLAHSYTKSKGTGFTDHTYHFTTFTLTASVYQSDTSKSSLAIIEANEPACSFANQIERDALRAINTILGM